MTRPCSSGSCGELVMFYCVGPSSEPPCALQWTARLNALAGFYYYAAMITRGICRKITALAVAYMIAIQAVITGLLPVSPVAAEFRSVLCNTVNSAAPELPGKSGAQHDGIICCLAAACSSPTTIVAQDTDDSVG